MEEIWKPITGFVNYQVSNFGNVKSLGRVISQGQGQRTVPERQLKQNLTRKTGYLKVNLYTAEIKIVNKAVHKLVAAAFVENPQQLPMVNHKDENPLNNHADNLEWCTNKYNSNYGNSCKKRSVSAKNRRSK